MTSFDPECLELYEAGAAAIDRCPPGPLRDELARLYELLERATLEGAAVGARHFQARLQELLEAGERVA